MMDTNELIEWNNKLTKLLSEPESERNEIWWVMSVGSHLEKLANSWHQCEDCPKAVKA
jgi:hypothetical protein